MHGTYSAKNTKSTNHTVDPTHTRRSYGQDLITNHMRVFTSNIVAYYAQGNTETKEEVVKEMQ
jgi:hypothetical protein